MQSQNHALTTPQSADPQSGVQPAFHRHEGAVKTSPNSPSQELENLKELQKYANLYNPKLLKYFEKDETETKLLVCEETLYEKRPPSSLQGGPNHGTTGNENGLKDWAKISIYNTIDIDTDIFKQKVKKNTNSKQIKLDLFNKQTKDLLLQNITSIQKLGTRNRIQYLENELKRIHRKYEELAYKLDRDGRRAHSNTGFHTDNTIRTTTTRTTTIIK